MSAGDPDDVHRSLRRYISQTLGSPPWKVRLQRTRVADDQRPVAIVESGPVATPQARAAVNQGDVQKQQTFTVVAYPSIGGDAESSSELARQVVTLLDAGISRGLVTDDVPPVLIGAPFRIPVYDFAGVPITGPGRGGPTVPYMHANVDLTGNVRPVQDALDELRYTVVMTLRLSWWAGGRIPPTAPIAISAAGTFKPGFRP